MSSTMKRSRQEFEAFNDGLASVANYLMLLSQTAAASKPPPPTDTYSGNAPHHDRMFECKTCSRQFPSFQALGGHRASHKKPKLSGPVPAQTGARSSSENSSISNDNHCYSSPPAKAKKAHECSICGAEFALGQALGGHMRRHRAAVSVEDLPSTTLSLSCRPLTEVKKAADKTVMVMSGGAGGGSTLCLDLCL